MAAPNPFAMIFKTIDDYISSFPPGTQKILTQIRHTIAENAPEATEKISYNIPTFCLNGNLVHFAGYKNHIGFYPDPTAMEKFEKDLSPYKTGKGSVQFPLNEEIPYNLIAEIVRYRVNVSQQEVA